MQKFTREDYRSSQKRKPKVNKSDVNQSSHLVQSVSELENTSGRVSGQACMLFPGILTFF